MSILGFSSKASIAQLLRVHPLVLFLLAYIFLLTLSPHKLVGCFHIRSPSASSLEIVRNIDIRSRVTRKSRIYPPAAVPFFHRTKRCVLNAAPISTTTTDIMDEESMYLASMFGLQDKVAIVTGSTAGLGRAIAEALFCAGATVIVNGRNEERTSKAVADIYAKYGRSEGLLSVAGDCSSPEFAHRIIDTTVKQFGQLDILINNAGINIPEARFEDNDLNSDWESICNANLRGPMQLTRAALPYLKQSTAGRVINLASIGAHVGLDSNTLYTVTKGGVLLFTKSLSAELAATTVTVNSVSPGVMITPMNAKFAVGSAAHEAVVQNIPMRRMGAAKEITGAFLLLASDASAYITGADIIVDGGYSCT